MSPFIVYPRYTVVCPEDPEIHPATGERLWTAWYAELRGCVGYGQSRAAAIRNLHDGLPGFLAMLTEHGQPWPRPSEGREG